MHSRRSLVFLHDRAPGHPHLDLVVVLNDGAARAPVRSAAVLEARAADAKVFADFLALEKGVDPSTSGQAMYGAEDHAVRVAAFIRLEGRIAEALRGLADD